LPGGAAFLDGRLRNAVVLSMGTLPDVLDRRGLTEVLGD